MNEQLNNVLYNKTMNVIYPHLPLIKDIINSEELLNVYEELLNECKILYNKDDLADLTEEEFKSFIWNKVVKLVDDRQRALQSFLNNFGF